MGRPEIVLKTGSCRAGEPDLFLQLPVSGAEPLCLYSENRDFYGNSGSVRGGTLVLQKYPDMCNLELKYRLWNSCEKGRYYDQRQGHGNLHVEKFLECQEKILDTNENLLYDSTGDK